MPDRFKRERSTKDARRQEGGKALTKEEMKAAGLYDLFGEAYRLLQDHAGQQAIDWKAATDEADRICNDRAGTDLERLASRLVFAIMDYLDRTSKGPTACPQGRGAAHGRP